MCVCVYFIVADCVRAGAGRRSQETEVGLQAGASGGLHESGELRTALPRVHWEETPSETEPCLSEDLSPPTLFLLPPPHHVTSSFRLSEMASSSTFSFSCFLQPEKIFLFNSSTLLHRLVLSEHTWRVVLGAEVGISHSAVQGIPRLHHGGMVWKLAILAFSSSLRWKEWKGRKKNNFFLLPSRIYTDRWFLKKKHTHTHNGGCQFCWELFFFFFKQID